MAADRLPDDEIAKRARTLDPEHWALLACMEQSDRLIKRGTNGALLARKLQLVAFVWPKRSPRWGITHNGRRALAMRHTPKPEAPAAHA